MVELLIILALGVGHFSIFDRTEVFRSVVLKKLICLHMLEWFLWVPCGLQDLSHSKISIYEANIEQFPTVCFIGTHGFQMPIVYPKGVGWGYLISEAAPGDWAIEILEVQSPIYAPMCHLLGEVGHNVDRCISCKNN